MEDSGVDSAMDSDSDVMMVDSGMDSGVDSGMDSGVSAPGLGNLLPWHNAQKSIVLLLLFL